MERFNEGDIVRFIQPSNGAIRRMSEDKDYTVVEYDHNDKGWPDGCCGTPFVRVIADDGQPIDTYAYRFRRVAA